MVVRSEGREDRLGTRAALVVLFLGVFMAALDVAIVAPALPVLQRQFGADTVTISLVVLIYSLCSLTSTAPLSSASDRYGRRRVYLL